MIFMSRLLTGPAFRSGWSKLPMKFHCSEMMQLGNYSVDLETIRINERVVSRIQQIHKKKYTSIENYYLIEQKYCTTKCRVRVCACTVPSSFNFNKQPWNLREQRRSITSNWQEIAKESSWNTASIDAWPLLGDSSCQCSIQLISRDI